MERRRRRRRFVDKSTAAGRANKRACMKPLSPHCTFTTGLWRACTAGFVLRVAVVVVVIAVRRRQSGYRRSRSHRSSLNGLRHCRRRRRFCIADELIGKLARCVRKQRETRAHNLLELRAFLERPESQATAATCACWAPGLQRACTMMMMMMMMFDVGLVEVLLARCRAGVLLRDDDEVTTVKLAPLAPPGTPRRASRGAAWLSNFRCPQ